MSERNYSVPEIDRMRRAIQLRGECPMPNLYGNMAQSFDQQMAIWDSQIENHLRTHMLAGVSPEELETAAPAGPVIGWLEGYNSSAEAKFHQVEKARLKLDEERAKSAAGGLGQR